MSENNSQKLVITGTDSRSWRDSEHLRLKWSVSELVALRNETGDLNLAGSGFTGHWIEMGQKAHKAVVKKIAESAHHFESEKVLELECFFPDLNVTLSLGGRADIVYTETSGLFQADILEEIKSTINPRQLEAELTEKMLTHSHGEQAMLYGYMYQLLKGEPPATRVRIVDIFDFDQQSVIDLSWTTDDARNLLLKRVSFWREKHENFLARIKKRKQWAKNLAFPFSMVRDGQSRVMKQIEDAMNQDKNILIQAPTGIGKTAAVIYPTLVKALSSDDLIFYLVPKGSQMQAPTQFLRKDLGINNELKVAILTAKEKLCINSKMECRGETCPFASKYHDRKNNSELSAEMNRRSIFDLNDFKELGQKFTLCPYQLSREYAADADVIIGDYNYVFSPQTRLETFFSEESFVKKYFSYRLLVDEAHNLPQRLRDIFSYELPLELTHQLIDEMLTQSKSADRKKVIKLAHGWSEFQDNLKTNQKIIQDRDLLHQKIEEICHDISKIVRKKSSKAPMPTDDPAWLAFLQIKRFLEGLELGPEKHFLHLEVKDKKTTLRNDCLDPSMAANTALEGIKHTVFLSGTLLPFSHFIAELGLNPEATETWEEEYPFDLSNRKMLIIPQASTRLRWRLRELPKIASIIEKVCSLKSGNYMVFFPSFQLLDQVSQALAIQDFDVIIQRPNMSPEESSAVIDRFHEKKRPTLLLGVQGGIFSEGIDLPGSSLIGVIVVGPALPAITPERQAMLHHFEKTTPGQGYNRTYIYPAMARSIQAAGRLMRRADDRGLLILLDDRFLESAYQKSFPKDWNKDHYQVSQSILNDIRNFWAQHD